MELLVHKNRMTEGTNIVVVLLIVASPYWVFLKCCLSIEFCLVVLQGRSELLILEFILFPTTETAHKEVIQG